MGTLLALASALSYGVSDFLGGMASRRIWFLRAALLGQIGGLVSMAALAPLISTAMPSTADFVWGGLSGLGTGVAMMFLFRGMGRGAMSVVVPTSAVGGVAIPVLVGVIALGERPAPLAWAGISLAVPALWAVSRGQTNGRFRLDAAVGDGLLSSVGIALQYLTLAQADPESGIWAVVAGRVTAVITLAILRKVLGVAVAVPKNGPANVDVVAAVAGLLAGLALTAYLLATRVELVAVAVVLSSLYPIVPVLLGITVLRERLIWRQGAGLAAALAATVLIAAS